VEEVAANSNKYRFPLSLRVSLKLLAALALLGVTTHADVDGTLRRALT